MAGGLDEAVQRAKEQAASCAQLIEALRACPTARVILEIEFDDMPARLEDLFRDLWFHVGRVVIF